MKLFCHNVKSFWYFAQSMAVILAVILPWICSKFQNESITDMDVMEDYNMTVVFFPGFDRLIPGFDWFIPGFDRFSFASCPVRRDNTLGSWCQQHTQTSMINHLTHWGRVAHICVSKLTIIGTDNGLSPGRRQAIIWTNAGILLIGPLGTNFSEILIEILTFSFTKMRLKVSSAKWRPFCLGLNELNKVRRDLDLSWIWVGYPILQSPDVNMPAADFQVPVTAACWKIIEFTTTILFLQDNSATNSLGNYGIICDSGRL